jgi:hypothetical protein
VILLTLAHLSNEPSAGGSRRARLARRLIGGLEEASLFNDFNGAGSTY